MPRWTRLSFEYSKTWLSALKQVANTTAHDVCRYTFLQHSDPTWNRMVRQGSRITVADVPQPPCPLGKYIYHTVSIVKVKWILALRLRRIVTASCQWLLFHIKICSSLLLGFVRFTTQLFGEASVATIIALEIRAFNFSRLAVDTGHSMEWCVVWLIPI
jgi:hypothetical protein